MQTFEFLSCVTHLYFKPSEMADMKYQLSVEEEICVAQVCFPSILLAYMYNKSFVAVVITIHAPIAILSTSPQRTLGEENPP